MSNADMIPYELSVLRLCSFSASVLEELGMRMEPHGECVMQIYNCCFATPDNNTISHKHWTGQSWQDIPQGS